MKNLSALSNFRVIDTDRGIIIPTRNNDYILESTGKLVQLKESGFSSGLFLQALDENLIAVHKIGMKDTKGIEIYAGDVVDIHPNNDLGVIFWEPESNGYKIKELETGIIWKLSTSSITVIGFIYEKRFGKTKILG